MKLKFNFSMLFLGALFTFVACEDAAFLLGEQRHKIDFIHYNANQKLTVAKAASNLLSIFVHREQKIDYYKSQYPNIDPMPRISKVLENAHQMTDRDFHYNISEIFNSLRDRHTRYVLPPPHSCYQFQTAVAYAITESNDLLNPTVLVSAFTEEEQVLKLSPEAKNINIGDQLMSINGMSFPQYVKQTAFRYVGANDYGSMRTSLKALSILRGSLFPMPETDELKLILKNRNGNEYSVTLPWIATSPQYCLDNASTTKPGTPIPQPDAKSAMEMGANDQSPNLPMLKHATTSPDIKQKTTSFELHKTSDSTIQWGLFEIDDRKLGIIILSSFRTDVGIDDAFELIKGLISNELKDTNGIVFDVRENNGGKIHLAELIPTAFSSDLSVPLYRALNNDINKKMLETGYEGKDWKNAIEKQGTYTKTLLIDPLEQGLKVIYKKPVGIFMNANCFSSCDLFTAIMKDSKIAKIYGEDPNTGGNGAHAITYRLARSFFNDTEEPFPSLPLLEQDFGVSWRQMIRQGPSKGKVIEDYGVEADLIVRPRLEDILNKNSKTQWERIALDLLK